MTTEILVHAQINDSALVFHLLLQSLSSLLDDFCMLLCDKSINKFLLWQCAWFWTVNFIMNSGSSKRSREVIPSYSSGKSAVARTGALIGRPVEQPRSYERNTSQV